MAGLPEQRKGDLFRRESRESLSSPEELYDYIRVNKPRMWTILLALFFLGAAGVFWIFTALIPLTVSVKARRIDGGRYIAFVSPELGAGLRPGMAVRIGKRRGAVASVAGIPLSRREAIRSLQEDFRLSGDYAAYALGLGEWNVTLILSVPDGEAPEEGPGVSPGGAFEQAVIRSAGIRPLDFFNGN
jgi:hypothetical protein